MAAGRLSGTDRSPPRFPVTCCKGREAVVEPLWVIPRGRICQDAPPSFTTAGKPHNGRKFAQAMTK